jgi:hypothetical protein
MFQVPGTKAVFKLKFDGSLTNKKTSPYNQATGENYHEVMKG